MADLRDTDWRKHPLASTYAGAIEKAAAANDVPVELLGALLHRENRFRTAGSSQAGAKGIAQIVPKFHPGVDPMNPEEAIPYAASYLADNYERFGDWDRALAAYNHGPTAVRSYGDEWESRIPQETIDYVNALSPSRVNYVEPEAAPDDYLDQLTNVVNEQAKQSNDDIGGILEEMKLEDELAENTNPHTRPWLLDVGQSPARGGFKALRAAFRGMYDAASKITEYTGDFGYDFKEGFYARSPAEVKARNSGQSTADALVTAQGISAPRESIVDAALTGAVNLYGGSAQTGTGQFVETASQFITGMIVLRKAQPGALEKSGRAAKTLYSIGEGAVVGGTFFEAAEQNLADLIESSKAPGGSPDFSNTLTAWLADKTDNTELEGRFKNSISDFLGGAMVEPLFAAIGALKAARKVKTLNEAQAIDERIEINLGRMDDGLRQEAETPQAAQVTPAAGKVVPEGSPKGTVADIKLVDEFDAATGETIVRSPNGEMLGTQTDSAIRISRSDVAEAARGKGEGLALLRRFAQRAAERDLPLFSDVSISPAQVRVWAKLKDEGFNVKQNEASINPETGNLVSADPRKSVFEVQPVPAKAADDVLVTEPHVPPPKSFEPKTESFATDPLEVQEANLRDRLGLTDEKVAEIRGKIQRGEIQPEAVDDLINLNGDRIDWSGITDEKAAVGLWNTTARVLDNTVGGVAGHRRVSIDSVEKIVTDELGGTVDEAYSLWDTLKSAGGLEARMWSARKVLAGSLSKLSNLSTRIHGGNFSPEDLLELAVHDRRHALLQAVVRGSKSIVARTLRLMRETVEANESAFKLADARKQRDVRKAQEGVDRAKAKRKPGAEAELNKLRSDLDKAIADTQKAKVKVAKAQPAGALTDAEKAQLKADRESLNAAMREEKKARDAHARAAKEESAVESVERILKEAKAEGRQLTRSDVEQALNAMGMTARQVRRLASQYVKAGKNSAKANRVARSVSWGQRIQERLAGLYINNILSGTPTMAINVMSFWLKMADTTVERYGALAVKAVKTFGKVDKYDFLTAHRAVMASRVAWSDSWRLAKALFGEGKLADRMNAAMTDNTSAFANMLRAAKTGKPVTDFINATEMESHGGVAKSLLGKTLQLPSHAIVTIDEYAKTVFYRQELTARAVEIAAAKARLVPSVGKTSDKVFEAEFKRIMDNPPDDVHLEAVQNARYQTFQTPLESKSAQLLTRLVNGTPLARLIIPFIRTPGNIMKQAVLERTPLAALRVKVWKEILQGGRQGDTVAFRTMLAGTAFAIIYDAAWDGRLTGSKKSYRSNKNSADVDDEFAYGYVRDDGTVLQYSRFDPWGTVISLTTDIALLQKERERRNENDLTADDMEFQELFGSVFAILSENILDKVYFKGLSDFVAAFEQGGNVAANYFGNITANLQPFSSFTRNWARANDDYQREAFTLVEKLKKQLPGLRDDLNVKRDILGRPMPESARLGWDGVSPVLISKTDPDPAARAYAELEIDYRMPRGNIDGVELTSQQYSQLLEVRGGFIRKHIQDRIDSGEWARMPRYARTAIVKAVAEQGTRLAEIQLLRDNDDLRNAIDERGAAVEALRTAE
jgi:protein-disulfide isomerase-like protein with CxxC motif